MSWGEKTRMVVALVGEVKMWSGRLPRTNEQEKLSLIVAGAMKACLAKAIGEEAE